MSLRYWMLLRYGSFEVLRYWSLRYWYFEILESEILKYWIIYARVDLPGRAVNFTDSWALTRFPRPWKHKVAALVFWSRVLDLYFGACVIMLCIFNRVDPPRNQNVFESARQRHPKRDSKTRLQNTTPGQTRQAPHILWRPGQYFLFQKCM